MRHVFHRAGDFVVFEVIFTVLDVVAFDDCEISMVVFGFVSEQVDFLEKLLLVVLEFPHC